MNDTFKVFEKGDRVKYIIQDSRKTGHYPILNNKTGTIVSDNRKNLYGDYYYVEFDEKFHGGHNCDGYAKPGHGYSVSPIYLEHDYQTDTETKIRWYKNGKLQPCKVEKNKKNIYNDELTDEFRNFLIDNNAYEKFIRLYNKISKFSALPSKEYIA